MNETFVLPDHVDPAFPFWIVEEDDGSLTINWDPGHSVTSVFNDWTSEQFITMLCNAANEVIAKHEETSCQNQ
jgi:D-hexose-6-phosphate mutarotase